jgi:hypothetical protein
VNSVHLPFTKYGSKKIRELTFIDASKVSAVSLRPVSTEENLSVVAVHRTMTFT